MRYDKGWQDETTPRERVRGIVKTVVECEEELTAAAIQTQFHYETGHYAPADIVLEEINAQEGKARASSEGQHEDQERPKASGKQAKG